MIVKKSLFKSTLLHTSQVLGDIVTASSVADRETTRGKGGYFDEDQTNPIFLSGSEMSGSSNGSTLAFDPDMR